MRRGIAVLTPVLLCVSVLHAQRPAPPTELQKAVEEFKTQTRNLGLRPDSPRRARATGSRMRWHGRLFHNIRNDAFDAIPHEIRQIGGTKSLLRRNQFGFNIAGPVVIPRLFDGGRNTFFSLSYEGVRERISRSYLRTIPTTPERSGDFSSVVDQAGNLLPIYDPSSTRLNPEFNPDLPVALDNLQYLRDQFPGNRIPLSRLDPAALAAVRFYPQPNTNIGPFFRNNYAAIAPEANTANGMIAKVDHNLGEKQRLAVGVTFSNGFAGTARLFPTPADPQPADRQFSSRRGTVDHVFTFSPRSINTVGFDLTSDTSQNVSERAEGGQIFPVYRFLPYIQMGRFNPVARNVRNTLTLGNSFSTRRGTHSLRGNARLMHQQVNTFFPQAPAGALRFGPGLTSLPGIVNTGHAFASFMLGLPEFGEETLIPAPSYFRRSSFQLTASDQYEFRPGLTFNGSLNLDISTPRTEKFNRQSTIDRQATNPVNGRRGALVHAGQPNYGRAFQPVRVRLEPSASVAWSPRNNTKTVLRLAYSRSYAAIPIYFGQWGTQGFNSLRNFISPNIQLEPALRLSNGLPPLARPLPDLRPDTANDTIADLMDMSARQPVYDSASFSLERQLPGALVVTFGAYRSWGKDLLLGNSSVDLNAIPLDALEYRDQLNNESFRRSLRPFPQYQGFDVGSSYPLGRYNRDASYVRLEKRSSAGLSLTAYYEFSKQMDDYSGPYGIQDFYNRQKEWSLTAGSNPHRLSLSYVYELPLGPNKAYLSFSDWRRYFVEGWSLSGLSSVNSGDPLALRPQFNNTGGVLSTLNVDVVPGVNPHVADPGPFLWFNPAAFAQPDDFTVGTASRTHPTLRAPGSQVHDLSLNKRFALSPERAVELSANAFNFINRANWNDPDTVIGPASAPNVNAGRIIGSRGGRVIQLGLRFSF